MLSKKLISFLEEFTPKELGRFEKFMRSPIWNENEKLSFLYEMLLPSLRKKTAYPTKEALFKKLFPGEQYSDVKIRKLLSSLLGLAIEFKAIELWKKSPEQQYLLHLKAVSRPNLKTHIASTNRKLAQILEKTHTIDSYQTRLEAGLQNHKITEQAKDRKKLSKLKDLTGALDNLEVFYLAQKLRIFTEVINYQSFMQVTAEIEVPESFFESVPRSPFFDKPIIQVYYRIARMLRFPENEQFFHDLKSWLKENDRLFSKEQQLEFYSHLIVYGISYKINKGVEAYAREVFDLFKTMIAKELIFTPYLSTDYYRNIISIGLHLKEFDYIEDFISKYSEKLPPDQKENETVFSLARLYYNRKDYDKVLELLQDVELTNLSYALGTRIILVGTFYELGEMRALESHLLSFRIFILRNKLLSGARKQSYLNFLKFTKKMISLPEYSQSAKEKLRQKIIANENVANRDWLLEKLENG